MKTSSEKQQNFLRIEHIELERDNQLQLQDISFTLRRGQILGLLGPSGAGKTSLLRLIAGLEQMAGGKIVMGDTVLNRIAPHKRKIGMMFQEYALFPHKNVLENVCFGLEMQKTDEDERLRRSREMLDLVDLKGFETRRIDELSGGERQRVALARSLAPRPELLLLDEPFGSLDRQLREQLAPTTLEILKSLDMTTIFVTHDQAEAFSITDRVAVLDSGKLLQNDTPLDLYRTPASLKVARFLGLDNILLPDNPTEKGKHLYQRLSSELNDCDNPGGPLLIYPQGAQLSADPHRDEIIIQGVITRCLFLGGRFRVTVESDETSLSFELPIDTPPPEREATVSLHIGKANCTFLPPEAQGTDE